MIERVQRAPRELGNGRDSEILVNGEPYTAHRTLLRTIVFPKREPVENIEIHQTLLPEAKKEDSFHKFADSFVAMLSTPGAIIFQAVGFGGYLLFNTLAVTKAIRFDGPPFLLLNAAVSIWSAFTASLVLNSNRRQDAENDVQTKELLNEIKEIKKILSDKK